jgi:dienelactone hydrolase
MPSDARSPRAEAAPREGDTPLAPRALSLSPSACHRILLEDTEPALAYRGGPVKAFQRRLRPALRKLTGFDRLPALGARPALASRTLGRFEQPLGAIEKIVFRAEPGADVPGYFCVPHGARPPYPVVICLQGHTTGMHQSIAVAAEDERAPVEVEGDRDFALGCLRRGVAALCLEQRSFGERRELLQPRRSFHNDCHDAAMRALLLGRTLLAERVYDVDRGIDYLASRGDVDLTRVGVMGNSGGGTVAIWAGALLPRVRFLMPSCSFCTLLDSIASIHHCADNYVPGLALVADLDDVLGLFAPRPVVVVAGASDAIFPLPGVRRAFLRLQAIYRAAGAEDRCRLVVGPEGHRFYEELAWGEGAGFFP